MPRWSTCITLLVATLVAQTADARDFRFDGVCLSVDMRKHDYYSTNNRRPFGSPFILIPAPYPTPELTDRPDRMGLGTFFLPITERNYTSRLQSRDRSGPGDCIETRHDFGLLEVSDDPGHIPKSTDPITCAAVNTHLELVPEDPSIPLELSCPDPNRAGACWGSYYLDQSFEARFLVSPEHLPDWRLIVKTVTAFFEESVDLC